MRTTAKTTTRTTTGTTTKTTTGTTARTRTGTGISTGAGTLIAALLLGQLLWATTAHAQTADDILNILTKKGTITRQEADSIRRESTIRLNRSEAAADSFPLRLGRSLSLSGYTQVVYQNFEHPVVGKITDGFTIKRARLDFQGHFSSQFDYRLLADFIGQSGANGTAATGGQLISPFLVEAYIVYKPFAGLNVKAGQMIVEFGPENTTQDRNLDLIERSQVVNALVARKGDAANGLVDSIGNQNGRDIGIQLNGSLVRLEGRHLIDYYVQLLNGAGINTLDNNPSKDIDARLVIHPLRFLSLGGSYYDGFDRFTGTPAKDQLRTRWGLESVLDLDRLSVKGEYIHGQDGTTDLKTGTTATIHQGWYGQLGYFILPRHLQGVFRYDWYDPNTAKSNIKSTYYDFGLNYFFNVWTKVQVYYSLRDQEGPAINNNMFEAQLQLAF
ncbi:MAG TPA: porin [Puia sp.]|nr:porin [Puia sp.]